MKKAIFAPSAIRPYYTVIEVDITSAFHPEYTGRRAEINAVHKEFKKMYPDLPKPLEVSTATYQKPQGLWLSASHLKKNVDGKSYPFESVIEGCKKFEHGGPYKQLYKLPPSKAKRDPRVKFRGMQLWYIFATEHEEIVMLPELSEIFYNYMYIKAILENGPSNIEALGYETFTDIFYDPEKGGDTPARAAAQLIGLLRMHEQNCLVEFKSFVKTCYESYEWFKDNDETEVFSND